MSGIQSIVSQLEEEVVKVGVIRSDAKAAKVRHVKGVKRAESKITACNDLEKELGEKLKILGAVNEVMEEFRAGVSKFPGGKRVAELILDSGPAEFLQELGIGTAEEILEMTPNALVTVLKKNAHFFSLLHGALKKRGVTFQVKEYG